MALPTEEKLLWDPGLQQDQIIGHLMSVTTQGNIYAH